MFKFILLLLKKYSLIQIIIFTIIFIIANIYKRNKIKSYKNKKLSPYEPDDFKTYILFVSISAIPVLGIIFILIFCLAELNPHSAVSFYKSTMGKKCEDFFKSNLDYDAIKEYQNIINYHYRIILDPNNSYNEIISTNFLELTNIIENNKDVLKFTEKDDLANAKLVIKSTITQYLDWVYELMKKDLSDNKDIALHNINSYKDFLEDMTESIKKS